MGTELNSSKVRQYVIVFVFEVHLAGPKRLLPMVPCGMKLNHSSQHPNTGTFIFTHPTGLGFVRLTDSSQEEMIQKKRVWPIEYSALMVGELLVVFYRGCSGRQCVTSM